MILVAKILARELKVSLNSTIHGRPEQSGADIGKNLKFNETKLRDRFLTDIKTRCKRRDLIGIDNAKA